MRAFPGRRSLTEAQAAALREDLRRRDALLRELAALSVKALAFKYAVSPDTVLRADHAVRGFHAPDPIAACAERHAQVAPALLQAVNT